MSSQLRCIVTFGMLLALPFLLGMLVRSGITRRRFAFITSLSYATLHFVLSILYVDDDPIVVGILMFLFTMIGGYPTAYFLYPKLHKPKDS